MCWFRPAFAIALDCAATRAGDGAWADRPGLPHRLADVLVRCRPATRPCTPFELAVGRSGRNLARGAVMGSRRLSPVPAEVARLIVGGKCVAAAAASASILARRRVICVPICDDQGRRFRGWSRVVAAMWSPAAVTMTLP